MKKFTALLLLSFAATLASAAEKLILQVGTPAPNMLHLPVYIAQQAGYFAAEGVEVELRHSPNAAVAAQVVSNGGADLAEFSFEPALLGYEKGIRGKFFFQTSSRLIYFAAVPQNSGIQSAKELAGKKVGVSNMGSASIFVLRSMLREAGVDESKVQLVPVGVGDSAAAALRSGQVHALSLWDSAYAGLEKSGFKYNYLYHPTIRDVGNNGYFVPDNSLARNSAKLQRFVRAVSKSVALIQDDPSAAVKFYWAANPAGKPAGDEAIALNKSLAELKFIFPAGQSKTERGLFAKQSVQKYLDEMKAVQLFTANLKVDDIVDHSIWKAATKSAVGN